MSRPSHFVATSQRRQERLVDLAGGCDAPVALEGLDGRGGLRAELAFDGTGVVPKVPEPGLYPCNPAVLRLFQRIQPGDEQMAHHAVRMQLDLRSVGGDLLL